MLVGDSGLQGPSLIIMQLFRSCCYCVCLQGALVPKVLTPADSVKLSLFCGLLCVLAAP